MQKIGFVITVICLIGQLNAASLNNGSVRPRTERAEAITPGGVGHHQSSQSTSSNQTNGEQLEFDFVNLPGYGVLDDINSTQSGNFSCYERRYGYYADTARHCTLFHLCYPVKEPNTGDIVYQRFSFACSDHSIFDQQHLLCLEQSAVVTPCEQSDKYFDASNQRLIAALQQSAPGFQLTNEGAVLNTTTSVVESAAAVSADSAAVLDGSALADESNGVPMSYQDDHHFYV